MKALILYTNTGAGHVSAGKSISKRSSITACDLVRIFFPPTLRAFSQVSQLQNIPGKPSAAAVPKYCNFISYSVYTRLSVKPSSLTLSHGNVKSPKTTFLLNSLPPNSSLTLSISRLPLKFAASLSIAAQ